MPHPALRIAPRHARLLVVALPLLVAACHVPNPRGPSWEGGADGFPTAELYVPPAEIACLEAWSDDRSLDGTEGGADGFTETGYAPARPECLAGAASGGQVAGGWGVLGGHGVAGGWGASGEWTPFAGRSADDTAPPQHFSGGLWDRSPLQMPRGPAVSPFLPLWPAVGTTATGTSAAPTSDPPGEDTPLDEETLLVADPSGGTSLGPAFAAAIAEPATLALLGSALVVLGLLRRERD